jgi:hypothetical protein
MKVNYVVIRLDDSISHVYSITKKSLKDAKEFVSFCRRHHKDPDGTYIIAKIVAEKRRPRRWRLE